MNIHSSLVNSGNKNVLIGNGPNEHGPRTLWYFSGKMLATVVLIIFPTLVLASQIALEEMRLYFIKGLENGSFTIQYINSNLYIYYIIIYFQYGVFLITLLVFPPFPAPHSTERYFKIRGFENAVIEYEFVRDILLVALVLLIIILAFTIALPFIHSYFPPPLNMILDPAILNVPTAGQEILPLHLIYYLRFYLFIIVLGAFLKLLFAIAKPEFRLYFAKGCFKIIVKKQNEADKMKYLIKGINSYNKYIKRWMNLQMSELTKIYSKISSSSQDERAEIIESLSSSIDQGSDNLETMKILLSLSKLTEEQFLVEQPVREKIKDLYTLLLPLLTIVVTLITTYVGRH
jgi:hypothetical protein